MMTEEFGKLISLAQDGDQEAMERLLEDFGDTIRREIRFCLLDRRLRRVVGESDVFQSVALKFAISLKDGRFHFDTPGDLVSLLKVMARAHVAYQARFWHAQRRDLRKNTGIDGIVETYTDNPQDGSLVERIELLELTLTYLEERDRQILDWRQDGVTWSEIASRLNVPSSEALRKQHQRALARVAQEVQNEESLARYQR